MIAQVTTPRQKRRFRNACRGTLCFGATMPLALELFGKSQPGRFFAGPTLALDIGGSTASMAGHANPEELASFLAFCGCSAAVMASYIVPGMRTRRYSNVLFIGTGALMNPQALMQGENIVGIAHLVHLRISD